MTEENNAIISKKIQLVLSESFESVIGYYLAKDTSFFETLSAIDSAKASVKFENANETIAGHIQHVILGLKYVQDYLLKRDLSRYEWNKHWQDTVDSATWHILIEDLKNEYKNMVEFIEGTDDWLGGNYLDSMMGAIAHCAYHLAIIRQHS